MFIGLRLFFTEIYKYPVPKSEKFVFLVPGMLFFGAKDAFFRAAAQKSLMYASRSAPTDT